jgi:hypothetical protein
MYNQCLSFRQVNKRYSWTSLFINRLLVLVTCIYLYPLIVFLINFICISCFTSSFHLHLAPKAAAECFFHDFSDYLKFYFS